MQLYIRDRRVWCVLFEGAQGKPVRLSTKVPVGTDKRESKERAREVAKELVREYHKKTSTEAQEDDAPKPKLVSARHHTSLAFVLQREIDVNWSKLPYGVTLTPVVERMQDEIGHWLIHEITYLRLEDYVHGLQKDGGKGRALANGTINRRLSAISKALSRAVDRGELSSVPKIPYQKEDNKKDRFVAPAEEQRYLEWFSKMALDDAKDKRSEWTLMREFAVFLTDTGMRFSEVFKFIHDGAAVYFRHGTTKNKRPRRIPLTVRARAALAYLQGSADYAALLAMFKKDPSGKHAWDWCSPKWNRAMAALGINTADTPKRDRVTIHTLRHTFGSRLVQRGVSLITVRDLMGHSSVTVTERYAHLAPDNFGGALAALEQRPVAVPDSLPCTRAMSQDTESTAHMHSLEAKSLIG